MIEIDDDENTSPMKRRKENETLNESGDGVGRNPIVEIGSPERINCVMSRTEMRDVKLLCLFCSSSLSETLLPFNEFDLHLKDYHRIQDTEFRQILKFEAPCSSSSSSFTLRKSQEEIVEAFVQKINYSNELRPKTTSTSPTATPATSSCHTIKIKKSTPTKASTATHKIKKTKIRRYICNLCTFTAPMKSIIVNKHYPKMHPGQTPKPKLVRPQYMRVVVDRYVDVNEYLKKLQADEDEEEEVIIPELQVGQMVRSKLMGFPWWPSVILRPPGRLDEMYSYYDDKKYHVGFFEDDNIISRAWVPEKQVALFDFDDSKMAAAAKKNKKLREAFKWIEYCRHWTDEQRSLEFGSCHGEYNKQTGKRKKKSVATVATPPTSESPKLQYEEDVGNACKETNMSEFDKILSTFSS